MSSPTQTTSAPGSRLAHQVQALAHPFSGHAWRSAFTVRRVSGGIAPAVRVGIAAGLMLVLGGWAGQPQLAGIASLGALASAFSGSQPLPLRARHLALVGTALVLSTGLGAAMGAPGLPLAVQVAVLSLLAGAGALVFSAFTITGPGAVILVFAASAGAGFTHQSHQPPLVALAVAAAALGAVVGWLVAMSPALARTPRPDERHQVFSEGLASLRNCGFIHQAIRLAGASALSGWIAAAAGLDHPLWASMGAVAALQSLNFATTVQRSIQRLVGNVLGGLVAAGLILLQLDFWPTVALVVLFQMAAEILVVRNYILCTLAVTPMALLMTGLGSQLGPNAALSRMADTLVGVVLGVLVCAVTVSRTDRHHARLPAPAGTTLESTTAARA
ncbi:FUSC family protein [Pseudarthrobacter sp. P1]|uniref:FUSC family protein n=1 Tax=Pseudarthrobacter sp. P1 TaxID=3418418 RepID=UPI003CF70886